MRFVIVHTVPHSPAGVSVIAGWVPCHGDAVRQLLINARSLHEPGLGLCAWETETTGFEKIRPGAAGKSNKSMTE